MVKCLPEFEYFTVFLKSRNFISKIRRSKVTDFAALKRISAEIFETLSTNSVDPDQTAPAVCSGSTLFVSILMLTNKQTFSDVVILMAC